MRNTYGELLKPAKIGNMQLKNRICMAPMDFKYFSGNEEDSSMSYRQVKTFEARAKGGCGLIFTCATQAEREIMPYPRLMQFPVIDCDERVKEFAEAADAVHVYGAKIACELTMGSGRYADKVEDKYPPLAPSDCDTQYDPSIKARAMTKAEIRHMIRTYAEAAGRLKTAGFDALLVMGGGGYLINQFLSPAWNQRTDEYGGSLEKRMTFLIETLQEVKKVVGEDYPLIVSLNMDDLLPEGVSVQRGMIVEETIAVAQTLERMNLADAFHLRIGNYYDQEYIVPSAYVTNDIYMENFRKFKQAVTKPVIFENKLSDPAEMQNLLENHVLDFVSVGRKWIADPEWVNKALHNKPVKPCLRCNYCLHTLWMGKCTSCAINPEHGKEFEGEIQPAAKKKNVVVVGAGPGGIQAALTAEKRGHRVTLFEKTNKIGGKLDIVAAPSYKKEQYEEYLQYLRSCLNESNVMVCLETEATEDVIQECQADAVIIAAGAEPIIPPIKGIEKTVTADEVLRKEKSVAGTVAIIGGGLVGCETAHVLLAQGCKVHIVEMQDDVLKDASYVTRHSQLKVLKETGAVVHKNTKLIEVKDQEIIVEVNGKNETISVDDTILAVGYRNSSSLYDGLQNCVEEVYQIGDFRQTRKIADAVTEGYRIARNL
nr:FAD-dependent oxidoreductase [uncultured Faecalicatena sp.]